MRLFWHMVSLSFQQQLTYRMALLAGLATNIFFGLMRAYVLVALYQGRTEVNGLTLSGAITYVAFSQAMIAFLTIFGSMEVMNTVYNGSIGADLLRPQDLFIQWMARDLGRSVVNLIGRGALLIAIFALIFPLEFPESPEQWIGMFLALMLGWLVSFSWRFLLNLMAFWTPDARGLMRIGFTASQFLSGFLMPMRLYPDWFARICSYTPFPALFNTSIEAYLGIISGSALWLALANQLFWFVALAILVQVVLAAGVRRLVIQGG